MANLLETPRLTLRPWQDSDLDSLAEICSDPVVMKYVGSGEFWPVERCLAFIRKNTRLLEEYGYCQWGVEFNDNRQVIGFCGFVPHEGDIEIGWRLASRCHGLGLGLEAAKAAIQFAQHAGMTRVVARVQAENAASLRLAERLGMTKLTSLYRNGREIRQFEIRLDRKADQPRPLNGNPES